MSATLDKKSDDKSSGKYVDFQEYVEFQLHKARTQIRTTDLMTSATLAAVLFLGYLLLFVVADQWVFADGLPVVLRWSGLVLWLALLGVWVGTQVVWPLLRSVSGLFAAREVERAEPELRSNLLNWVDLQKRGQPVDPAVLRAIERQAAVQLSRIDVSQAIDHRPLLRSGYALLAVVVLFCLYAVLSPKKLGPSLARVLPMTEVAAPTRTEIREVSPGDSTVMARSIVEVTVDLAGVIPPQVTLLMTTADRKYRDEAVVMQPDGAAGTRFRTLLAGEGGQGVLQDLSYRIEAGDATSATYRIKVEQPPSARVESVAITPPAYTKLPVDRVSGGNFTGWEGSQAELTASVNLPVTSAVIEFLDDEHGAPNGEQVPATVEGGTKITAKWPLEMRSDGTYAHFYRVQCRTQDGREDPKPVVYEYSIRIDEPPTITLLSPDRDLELPANAVVPLLAEASDADFELGPVTLEVQQHDKVIARQILSQGQRKQLRLQHELALKPFGLKAGDEITYWLEAQDNRQPRRNRKQTPPLKIRIQEPASEQQVRDQLAEEKARQQDQLAELDQNLRDQAMNAERDPQERGQPGEERPPSAAPDQAQPMPGTQPDKANPGEDSPATEGSNPGGRGDQAARQNGGESRAMPAGQEPDRGTGDPGQQEQPPELSPDGEDDQKILEKLLQRNAEPSDSPPDSGSSDSGKSTNESPQRTADSSASQSPEGQQPGGDMPGEKDSSAGKPDQKTPPADGLGKRGEQKSPEQTTPGSQQERAGSQPDSGGKPGSETGSKPEKNPGPTEGERPDPQQPESRPGKNGDDSRNTNDVPKAASETGSGNPMNSPLSEGRPEQTTGARLAPSQPMPETGADQKSGTGPGQNTDPAMNRNGDQNADNGKNNSTTPKNESPPGTGPTDSGMPPGPGQSPNSRQKPDAGTGMKGEDAAGGTGDRPTDAGKPESGKPESGKPDSGKTDAGKPDDSTNAAGTAPSTRPGTGADPQPKPAEGAGRDGTPGAPDTVAPMNPTTPMNPSTPGKPEGMAQDGLPAGGESDSGAKSDSAASDSSKGKPSAADAPGKNASSQEDRPGQSNQTPPSSMKRDANGDTPPAPSPKSETETAPPGSQSPDAGKPNRQPSPGGPPSPEQAGKNSDSPTGARPTDRPANRTGNEPPADSPDAMNKPADQATGNDPRKTDDQAPGGQQPGGQQPGGQQPGGQQPGGQQPGGQQPGGQQPGGQQPGGQQPGGQQPGGQQPGGQQPGGQQPGGQQPGGQQPGGQQPGGQQPGGQQPGGQQPGGQQPGGQQPGGQQPGGQQPGGQQPGGQQPGGQQAGSGQGAGAPTSASGSGGRGDRMSGAPGGEAGPASDAGTAAPAQEAPNLDYKKQAAELALKRLKEGLSRGEVDQKLLDELGWNEAQLERFVDRMSDALQNSSQSPATPVEEARRLQFEEMLKSLDLNRSSQLRKGSDQPSREVEQIDSRRTPVPVEYRKAWERYTKTLSRSPASKAPAREK